MDINFWGSLNPQVLDAQTDTYISTICQKGNDYIIILCHIQACECHSCGLKGTDMLSDDG